MSKEIIIERLHTAPEDKEVISLEQWKVKRERRRKRVARRMARRFPLFAVQFTKEEFKDYTEDQFLKDIKGAKLPKYKGKSQLKRQGRYPLMQKALSNYLFKKDVKYLREAQRHRMNMFKPFELEYYLGGKTKRMTFPSTTSAKLIIELSQIKFSTWDELESILEKKLKWVHLS